jgi:type IV secretory pathway protease TraF
MTAITADKIRTFVPMFGAWLRTGWIYLAALAGSMLLFSHFFTFAVNASESLPQRAFLVLKYDKELQPGDYVAFTWQGRTPYPRGINFVKRVGGVGGQVVEERDREFFVDGVSMGVAKTHGSRGNMMGAQLEAMAAAKA